MEKTSKLESLLKHNFKLAKQVGRINDISKSKILDKNTVQILSKNEKISLKFNFRLLSYSTVNK